ncbi:MAG: hypothetical protein JW760_02015 [Spirochaetales bacterium]|nr:hypothetical protein [Spirochaetales bacterium]
MASITIRNISELMLEKIRILSRSGRRSMNNELLCLIEKGLRAEEEQFAGAYTVSREAQVSIWESISGAWEDNRSTEEIIHDIYSHRTPGRQVDL